MHDPSRSAHVNLTHLRSFYMVALEKSVSLAARRLGVSQPTLSKQLRALEDRHNVKLIGGVRPPLVLTPPGELLFEKARLLFETAASIGELLDPADGAGTTFLRLGTDSPPYAAEFVRAFLRQTPDSEFRVTISNAVETNRLLMQGHIDLAIICEPPIHAEYSYTPLYVDRLVAIVPAGWHGHGEGPVTVQVLAGETLLVRESTSRTLATLNGLLGEQELVPRRIMELHTREMIREGVAQGLGVSVMFRKECPPDARIRILPIDAENRSLAATGYLVMKGERKRLPTSLRAIAIASEMLARSSR